jgi:hypothetical protein
MSRYRLSKDPSGELEVDELWVLILASWILIDCACLGQMVLYGSMEQEFVLRLERAWNLRLLDLDVITDTSFYHIWHPAPRDRPPNPLPPDQGEATRNGPGWGLGETVLEEQILLSDDLYPRIKLTSLHGS